MMSCKSVKKVLMARGRSEVNLRMVSKMGKTKIRKEKRENKRERERQRRKKKRRGLSRSF